VKHESVANIGPSVIKPGGGIVAIDVLRTVANEANNQEKISRLMSSPAAQRELGAVVSLFERDYWRRLWVVQEIFNATSITVFCGSTKLPWIVYQRALQAFNQHRNDLDYYLPGGRRDGRRSTQFSYSQALVYQGPGSLPDLGSYMEMGEGSLLEVLRACRRKLTSDARDKLFEILGVLPIEVRKEFPADYSLSVKEVYTEIVTISSRRPNAWMSSVMQFISQSIQALLICLHLYLTGHTSHKQQPWATNSTSQRQRQPRPIANFLTND
jgi:hypothetical protein